MDSREIIRILQAHGWIHDRTKGSHHVFKDSVTGRIAVVPHPKKDVPIGTIKALERATGLKLLG